MKTGRGSKLGAQIISNLLSKYPNAPSKTIARIAFRDNPLLWTSLDSARSAVRNHRGAHGAFMRKCTRDKRHFRPLGRAGATLDLPTGKTTLASHEPLQIDGPTRALILADLHIPYHEKMPILAAVALGLRLGVKTILLDGDIADFFSVSFWQNNPLERDLAEELQTVIAFLASLRANFPRARIIYKAGNHEERWDRYMRVKCPEAYGIEIFQAEALLNLEKYGIEWVTDCRPVRLGALNVLHGHEYKFRISNPVNPARGLFLRAGAHTLCAHFHQGSYHSAKSIEDRDVAAWSIPCLCDLHPEYMPFNNWGHGLAVVDVDRDNKFQVRAHKISGSKVW